MIIILKIILSLFIILGGVVSRTLYRDFKQTETSLYYEESTLADKIKIKAILYFSLVAIVTFCLLLLYYVIVPMKITWGF